MRKLIALPLLSLAGLIFFFSCKKESRDIPVTAITGETLNIRIVPNQLYQLDLTNAGTISISKQATHFLMSETMVNNENGSQGYKYIPAADFTGNDEVVILSNKTDENHPVVNSGGCPGSSNANSTSIGTKYTTIKIVVGN